MRICALLLFVFVVFSLFSPPDALACACCAEPGTYVIRTKKLEKFELDELKKVRFANVNLFTTEFGEDDLNGIIPIGERYSLSGLLANKTWKLNFEDEKDKTGTLNLMSPTSMVSYMADIHDGKQGSAGGPLLYKEWRFKSKVQTGTGIFQRGIAPTTEYFLVLQGRGNNCTQAEDFTNWRLEITGKKASYAFYGELISSKTAVN